jgi:ornithine carbamoyltransferase
MRKPELRGRDFLTLLDYSEAEIDYLLKLALKMKKGKVARRLEGKSIAMLFQKNSTRTRMSFEAGMERLGGHAMYLNMQDTQMGRKETISDTAHTMSRYVEGIVARLRHHADLEALAEGASVPVVNALTDKFHPCQTLADMLTVLEKKRRVGGLKVAYVGDCGFNMFHSTMVGFSKMGAEVVGICPEKKEYNPDPGILELAQGAAGAYVSIEHEISEVRGADVVYTDEWVSMGQDEGSRRKDFEGFRVDSDLMKRAKKDAIFMHCLPARRGEEVTNEVIDGKQSVVFDQAENRLWAQNALLSELLG